MKNLPDFLVELTHRLRQDTPKFWIQIRIFWGFIVGISITIVGLDKAQIDILTKVMSPSMAAHLSEIMQYAAVVGVLSGLQTHFAVKDPIKPKDPEISEK